MRVCVSEREREMERDRKRNTTESWREEMALEDRGRVAHTSRWKVSVRYKNKKRIWTRRGVR